MEKIFVTSDEQAMLRLYRNCEQVTFVKRRQNKNEAYDFVSILGNPEYTKYDSTTEWCDSSNGKVTAVAFIEKGGFKNE